WDAVTALAALGTHGGEAARIAAEELGRALTLRKVPPEATVLAAGQLLRIAPASPHAEAAQRVLVAGLGARKEHVRGLAVEQLALVGGAWARGPLEKLARSGKREGLVESIAAALRAIEGRPQGGDHGDR
ncbi:MAG: hypothetical protein ACTHU0_28820, partial [Kofleriaceae bacterium]